MGSTRIDHPRISCGCGKGTPAPPNRRSVTMALKITALAGGTGGAKLVDGLTTLLEPDKLTLVVNTGDDFEHLGLAISPDLDTVTYTLAGLANPQSGWG